MFPRTTSINRAREACKGYYSAKVNLHKSCLESLEALESERKYSTIDKQMALTQLTTRLKLHPAEEMRRVRILAEKNRATRFKNIVKGSVTSYYKILTQMILQELPLTNTLTVFAGKFRIAAQITNHYRLYEDYNRKWSAV